MLTLLHHILPLLGESRLCETPDQMREIEKFRYRIYIRELGLRMQADHERERLGDALDETGLNFYRGSLLGTAAPVEDEDSDSPAMA